LPRLSFSASERRALYFLLVLMLVGSAVQIYKRFRPQAAPTYHIKRDTLDYADVAPRHDAAGEKLALGIDPNSAPAEDLELLPGIGPQLALRIIHDREAVGPYAKADDLLRVTGIGPHLLARLRPHLRFP
jgi:competence ComEA-like helix-hairpin-helix protein